MQLVLKGHLLFTVIGLHRPRRRRLIELRDIGAAKIPSDVCSCSGTHVKRWSTKAPCAGPVTDTGLITDAESVADAKIVKIR